MISQRFRLGQQATSRACPCRVPQNRLTLPAGNVRTAATTTAQFSTICEELLGAAATSDTHQSFSDQLSAIDPEVAKERVEALSEALGRDVAAAWLETHPALLLQTPQEVALHIKKISSLIGFPPEIVAVVASEHPSWIATPFDHLAAHYADLADLFSLSPVEMARVLASEPSLLATPAATIRRNLFELSSALGVGSGPIMRAAPQFPGLMTLTPATLAQRIAALAEHLRMLPEAVRSMLGASPRLASLPVGAVVGEWEGLRALLEGHENWLGQLDGLPPHLAAACLTSGQLKQRLLFFRETGLLETRYVNMASILTQDEADFASKYKGYIKWLRERVKLQREQRQQQQQAQGGGEAGEEQEEQAETESSQPQRDPATDA